MDADNNMDMENADHILMSMDDVTQMLTTVRGARYVQLFLLFICFVMVLLGPGFHLRQGWRAYAVHAELPAAANATDRELMTMYDCGYSPIRKAGEQKHGHGCEVPNHPELNVSTLKGHKGNASPKLWEDMRLSRQYGVIGVIVVVFMATTAALGLSYDTCPCRLTIAAKRTTVTSTLIICALGMLGVLSIEMYYLFCGEYPTITMERFDEQIVQLRTQLAKKNRTVLAVESSNKLVRCYVVGYGAAACLALLSMLIFIFDATMFYRMCKLEAMLTRMQLVPFNRKLKTNKPMPPIQVLKPDSSGIQTPIATDANIFPEPIVEPDMSSAFAIPAFLGGSSPSARSPKSETEDLSMKRRRVARTSAFRPSTPMQQQTNQRIHSASSSLT